MIDNFAIMFFGILIIYFVFRATKLDKISPWFQVNPSDKTESQADFPAKKQNIKK